jgi:hypothetical protein
MNIPGLAQKYDPTDTDTFPERPFRRVSTREIARLIAIADEIGLSQATVAAARSELRLRRRLAARRWGRW